jgi:EmrB/QacA subfamily drug resistance transporter
MAAETSTSTTNFYRSRARAAAVQAVLSLGLFMTLLDLSIVNIAIPGLAVDLHATLDQVLGTLNAYSLVFTVLLITSARLGDVHGPRNLFLAGLAVFTAASAASGLADGPNQLIAARAAQGLGAALMAPQSLAIITTILAPERRGVAFAVIGILGGLAVVAGPTLGGLIVTHWGWRWIFYVNLPVGVVALALTLLIVPDQRPGRRHRLDLAGVALATAGLLGVVFGLIEGQRYDWGRVWSFVTIPEIIGGGALVLAAFLVTQWRRQRREPLLDFAIFRDRNYSLMTVVLVAMGFSTLGLFLPLTIYLQSVLGLSAMDAGLTMAPMPIATMLVSPIGGMLAQRSGARYVLVAGLVLFAAGMAFVAWKAQTSSDRWSFVPGLVLAGAGQGCTWSPIYCIATRDLPPQLAGVASGVLKTVEELGTVLASAAAGALLQNRLAIALHDQAADVGAQLPLQQGAAFTQGFARGGLEIGPGQGGGGAGTRVSGMSADVVQHLANDVFTTAFVAAMRLSLTLLIVLVLAAAVVAWFAVRGPRSSGRTPTGECEVAASEREPELNANVALPAPRRSRPARSAPLLEGPVSGEGVGVGVAEHPEAGVEDLA